MERKIEGKTGEERKCVRGALERDRCERGTRDTAKGGREDGLRTHSSHMSVVSGLWAEMDRARKEGGRGAMKGGPVFNSARNCVKGRCASIEPSGERDREKYVKSSTSAT